MCYRKWEEVNRSITPTSCTPIAFFERCYVNEKVATWVISQDSSIIGVNLAQTEERKRIITSSPHVVASFLPGYGEALNRVKKRADTDTALPVGWDEISTLS